MKNLEIAGIFEHLADVIEIKGGEPFRVNAYRRAARVLSDLPEDIAAVAEEGRLTELAGVGKGTAAKIEEYLETGAVSAYDQEMKGVPEGLLELLAIPGLGPKTIGLLWRELDVRSVKGLRRELRRGSIPTLPGMGAKKAENIAAGLRAYASRSGRSTLGSILPTAEAILTDLRGHDAVLAADLAGSVRRRRETIGDIDVLAASNRPGEVIEAFTELSCVEEVLASGETKASARVEGALQVDLRVVEPASYGAALLYFTGSRDHNVHLRGLAQERGARLNEYGLTKGGRKLAGRTEEAVYHKLGLAYIPPELREDRGEIEAAAEGELPDLLTVDVLRGDLHVHSDWSDGLAGIETVARAAKSRGYSYVAITDHSHSLGVANGLSVERLRKQRKEIERVNRSVKGIRVLAGTEVDILSDGTIDFPDEELARLDVVVASIHSGFRQPEDRITKRMVAACGNPHVDIIAHPTGRLLEHREPYAVDLERVMAAAAETGTALEINAHHERLDLNDVNARRAVQMGASLVINTDAHNTDQLWSIELGVATARRGWVESGDVLNTLTPAKLLKRLSDGRASA
ncbi:MAG: DNA polymerase/3'-5' exonuclease PolX [Candidatus Eisenbacteria bacterium]|nr:DNA polymerase/3'-5' exonuclease PolX [Candidatus Eisenbacteria bacterium]